MKLEMDRTSHVVTVTGLEQGNTVTMTFGKEALAADVNKEGIVTFNCSKLIPKFLRQEIPVTVKRKGQNDIEAIYEVRMTKLVHRRNIEIRKEKKK